MCAIWPAFKFRMILDANEKTVGRDFNRFYQFSIWGCPGYFHSLFLKLLTVLVIEFVAMAMPFGDFLLPIGMMHYGIRMDFTWVCSQAHGSSFGNIPRLIRHQIDDLVHTCVGKFTGIGVCEVENISCIFNHSSLHSKTNTKIRDIVFSCIFCSHDFSFYSPVSKFHHRRQKCNQRSAL